MESDMEKEYNFSKAEKGKFYKPNTKLNIPIYLDDEAFAFVNDIARKKNTDITCVVNQILHSDKVLAETIR